MREVCGALTGVFMAAGLLYGYTSPADNAAKAAHYACIQQVASEFKERCGSIICRDLLQLQEQSGAPVPESSTAQYYAGRPCAHLVVIAAQILDEQIQEEPRAE